MLLALTTATETCSAALWTDEAGLVVEFTLERPRRHAERLVPMIRDALRHAAADPDALDAVALASGPGSYTGLRIGASTAKGLARAGDAALVGVPTLEAVAEVARPFAAAGDLLFTALRSRRGEVYAAAFLLDDDALRPLFEAEALTSADAARRLGTSAAEADRGVWLLGSGAARVAGALGTLDADAPSFRLVETVVPGAGAVARLGARRFHAGTVEEIAAFEPRYLKPFRPTPSGRKNG